MSHHLRRYWSTLKPDRKWQSWSTEPTTDHGIACREKNFSLFDVYGADEAFVTGTFGGLTPVMDVDGRALGDGQPGPMTQRLESLYRDEIDRAVRTAKQV